MLSENLRIIEQTLQNLGLVQSEIEVFFASLERGAATIKQLSEDTRLGRITTHEIVKRLIKKGLLLETYSGKKRLIYPNQVDAISNLFAHKKLEVEQLEHEAKKAASLLRSIQSQSENLPKTRFYKGKEGIQIVVNEIKQDKEDVHIMSDGQHFYDLIDNDFLEKSLDIRQRYKLNIQMIFPTGFEYFSFTQGTYQQQLHIKLVSESALPKGGLTIRGPKVAFHCYEGRFITTTIVENNAIAQIMSFLFEQIWKNTT